jgi:glycosyltransferase involved in cell wall biosynthesis
MRTSLVIPAYNEEKRLKFFLEALKKFVEQHPKALDEVIVVDDGSQDRTAKLAGLYFKVLPNLKVIRHARNRGKGAAVRTGFLAAHGDYLLFFDADGATPPETILSLRTALKRADVAIGNRFLPASSVRGRTFLRRFASWCYRTYVSLWGLGGIDTMCGCKGFRREAARKLFARLENERWLFDLEICWKARRAGFKIAAVPVRWTSRRGSKLSGKVFLRCLIEIPLLMKKLRRAWQSS